MAEVKHFPQAGFHATRENVARKVASAELAAANAPKLCVYNQTRERFVATGVEALDTDSGNAEARLRSLQPGAGAGLWMLPCPEISPTSIRFPVDLVYLNDEGAVLAAVESFPLASAAVSSAMAGSVLALHENAVAAGEIRVGDRLLVSAPEEMKRHLQSMKEAKAAAQDAHASYLDQFALPAAASSSGAVEKPAKIAAEPAPAALTDPAADVAGTVTDVHPPAAARAEFSGAEMLAQERPATAPRGETQPWKQKKDPRSWLQRLLQPEPVDPRMFSRESLPGLIAYYFTGGTPVGHPVRDISLTGMYILTDERWYPGTVVRVTLTDRHSPTNERSVTVNAKAVRWGTDGVGLEFVLEEPERRRSLTVDRMVRANGMDPSEIAEFLRVYKSPAQDD